MFNSNIIFIGLLLYIPYIVCQDPVVVITKTEPATVNGVVNGMQNKDVTFSCHVENKPPSYKVLWEKHNYNASSKKMSVSMVSTGTSLLDNTKYGIEIPVPNVWRLRVRRILISDEATFMCKVMLTRRSFTMDSLVLKVNIAPYIIAEATSFDRSVEWGHDTELKCQGSGIPKPVIEWTRMGNALLPIGTERFLGEELILKNVQSSARGIYRCRVWNTVGTVTRDINLKVLFKPEIEARQTISQAPGYRIELQCVVKSNPYPTLMSWSSGSLTFGEFDNVGRFQIHAIIGAFNHLTYELVIENVKEEDYGVFKCKFSNSFGSSEKLIELKRSATPQKSLKLGRIIKGTATAITISKLLIFIAFVLTVFNQ